MKKLISILLASFLFGCTAIGHTPPPDDWPKLEEQVHDVSFMELQSICGGNLLFQYYGCAFVNFDTKICTIYIGVAGESRAFVLEHEKDHCKGKDHVGSSVLADAWNQYKLKQGATAK